MKKRILWVLLLLTLVLSIAACKKEEKSDEPFVVKIGVLLDFSGEKKEESEQIFKACQLAVDEINNAGGVLTEGFSVELVKKDDCGEYMQTIGGYYQLVEEGVVAVIGTNNELGMEHLISAGNNSHVPVITPSVSIDKIVSAADFIYQSRMSDTYFAKACADFAGELELNSVALIFAPQGKIVNAPDKHKDRWISMYETMSAALLNKHIEISYAKEIDALSEDELKGAFAEAVKVGTDAVFVPCSGKEFEEIVLPAAKMAGYTGVFFATDEMMNLANTSDFSVYIPTGYHPSNPSKYSKEFLNRLAQYIPAADIKTDVRAGYDAVYMIRDAIEKGYLATATSIALKLPFLEGSTVLGEYVIGAYGNVEISVDFVNKKNNSITFVDTLYE